MPAFHYQMWKFTSSGKGEGAKYMDRTIITIQRRAANRYTERVTNTIHTVITNN